MQKNLYCTSHLSDKIISLSSRKRLNSGNHGDRKGGVGTKSKSIMSLEVDGVLGSGRLECASYRNEIKVASCIVITCEWEDR